MYSVHQEVGDRDTQQDRLCVHRVGPFLLAAVCDGYSGSFAAEFASSNLPGYLGDSPYAHGLEAEPAMQ